MNNEEDLGKHLLEFLVGESARSLNDDQERVVERRLSEEVINPFAVVDEVFAAYLLHNVVGTDDLVILDREKALFPVNLGELHARELAVDWICVVERVVLL